MERQHATPLQDGAWRTGHQVWLRYLAAVLLILADVGVRMGLSSILGMRTPYVTFYPAVMLAALYGGLGPGLLAMGLSALTVVLWREPLGAPLIHDSADWLGLGIFLSSCTMISAIIEAMHRARERVRRAEARQWAEQALRDEAARFRSLAESVPQLVWSARPDGFSEYYNKRFLDYLGKTLEEMQGWTWASTLHPDDMERAAAAWKEACANGTEYRIEYRIRRASDGQYRWHQGHGLPQRDAAGRIVGWFGTCTDIHDRKEAEERLRELNKQLIASQERLHLAQQAARIGTFEWDVQDNVNRWSPELEALYGLPAGSFGGRFEDWLACVHPEDRPAAVRDLQPPPGQDVCESEWRVIWPDGTVHWLMGRSFVFKDESGKPQRMVGVNIDITDYKRAEEMLRMTQFVVDHAADGVFWMTPDSRIIFVNDAACRSLGYTREELLTLSVPDIDPDISRENWPQIWSGLKARGTSNVESRHRAKDGRIIPIEVAANLLEFGGKEYNCAFVRDITERKRAEKALRESEEKLRRAVKIGKMGSLDWDLTTNQIVWSEETFHIYGYNPDEFTPTIDATIQMVPPEDSPFVQQHIEAVIRGEAEYNIEHRMRRPDGRMIFVQAQAEVTRDAQGNPLRMLGTVIDITERKLAQEQLRQQAEALAEADRRKDEFLAMLAHELRNPLAPIRNAVQLLRQRGMDPAVLSRQHDIIDRQVTHMARLLGDLLDVSRITHGKIELKNRPLALADVLAQAMETAMPLIQARRHVLEFAPLFAPVHVDGDLDRLAQALGNLLINAAKYTPEGGRIWLAASREGEEAVIRVSDTGVGITPDLLPRVFDLFTQADHSLDRAQGGLGIGLTLARTLVQLHGGTIEAHSPGLGQGSEFIIRLPALSGGQQLEGAAPSQPEPAISAAPVTRRILIVDDVVDTAESMAELLETWGHEVRAIYDGLSTLATAREFRPSTVLLDIGLPGLDGFAVARRLRADYGAGLLLIAVTGYGQESDREAALAAGFNHHLPKPVDLNILRDLLGSAQARA